MSDNAQDGISELVAACRKFIAAQPNEGNRLPMAKTHLDQMAYWLRVNDQVHQARKIADEKGLTA